MWLYCFTNDESTSDNVDSQVVPNYSINDDSYSNSSDSNSTSLHEVNVTALNGTQNEDFTVELENRKMRAEKREPFNRNEKEMNQIATKFRPHIQKLWKYYWSNWTEDTSLVGRIVERNIFLNSPTRKRLICQKISVCSDISAKGNFISHSVKLLAPKYW